jgi:hypothetical protein
MVKSRLTVEALFTGRVDHLEENHVEVGQSDDREYLGRHLEVDVGLVRDEVDTQSDHGETGDDNHHLVSLEQVFPVEEATAEVDADVHENEDYQEVGDAVGDLEEESVLLLNLRPRVSLVHETLHDIPGTGEEANTGSEDPLPFLVHAGALLTVLLVNSLEKNHPEVDQREVEEVGAKSGDNNGQSRGIVDIEEVEGVVHHDKGGSKNEGYLLFDYSDTLGDLLVVLVEEEEGKDREEGGSQLAEDHELVEFDVQSGHFELDTFKVVFESATVRVGLTDQVVRVDLDVVLVEGVVLELVDVGDGFPGEIDFEVPCLVGVEFVVNCLGFAFEEY